MPGPKTMNESKPKRPPGRPCNQPGLPRWCGNALRVRRIAQGWTLHDIAARLEVSKSTVVRWEHETSSPTHQHVARMAEALACPQDAFAREPRVV
jgi:transcriptional regulator with XRE-family HTH domain